METLITIITFLLLFGLIAVPALLFAGIKKWYKLKFEFIAFLVLGLILSGGIIWTLAWWTDYSDELLMSHYGYDLDAMNDTERFQNVESVNLERVKQLETGYYGIGWPLKATMSFIFYSPYLLFVYLIGQILITMKMKNKEHAPNNVYDS